MIYVNEEVAQWESQIAEAVKRDDDEGLYRLAGIIQTFDEEWADDVKKLARQADKNNWAYDNSIGN